MFIEWDGKLGREVKECQPPANLDSCVGVGGCRFNLDLARMKERHATGTEERCIVIKERESGNKKMVGSIFLIKS